MPVVHYEKIVNHAAKEMYNLVNDIERYQAFVPFCSGGRVVKKCDDWVEAELRFSFSGLSHAFTTKNTLIEHKMIDIDLVDGPFNHLDGKWQFSDLDDGNSLVMLDMDYEIVGFLSYLLGPAISHMPHRLVDVFVKRANDVYSN